jgi:hypothetical protein
MSGAAQAYSLAYKFKCQRTEDWGSPSGDVNLMAKGEQTPALESGLMAEARHDDAWGFLTKDRRSYCCISYIGATNSRRRRRVIRPYLESFGRQHPVSLSPPPPSITPAAFQ